MPIKIKTNVGFAILIDELLICVFGRDEILCSQPVDMDQHSIKNVKSPIDRLDAVNKAYADRIKYKTASGNIPNTVFERPYTLHISHWKSFCQWKDKICEIWVERLVGEWIATSSPMCATEWPGFHKFSRDPSRMTFFSGSPASG